MNRIVLAMRTFQALALPYFRSEDRWRGRALAAGVIILEFLLVYVAVVTNQWNGRFFNALEARDWDSARDELMIFGLILLGSISTGYAQYWLGQHFQIRWRRWMTERFVGRWMAEGRHYRVRFIDAQVDNIHLRIANDISVFIQKTHELGSGLIGVVITLVSFAFILWSISATTPLPLFGIDLSFPGYLILVAFIYSCIGTLLAHLIGRRLVSLNFNQQRREADLRFATARATDRSEQVALTHAEPVERAEIRRRLNALIANWTRLVGVNSNLTAFTYGYSHVSSIFPTLIVAPAYLAGAIPLGVLVQSALAFQRVESGFSYLITAYSRIAEWKAAMDRLWQLEQAMLHVDEAGSATTGLKVAAGSGPRLTIRDLQLRLPSGTLIAAVSDVTLAPGDHLLVGGASGAGKSILFRALSGIWPFGTGRIELPANTRLLALPSRPYFPLGTLRQALAVPAPFEDTDDETIRAAMEAVGLASLTARLDEEDEWATTLSGGQQQRIGFARVLIHRPNLLLLDDAVSNLEDGDVRDLYRTLGERLPDMIIISTGRSPRLAALHRLNLDLSGPSVDRQAAPSPTTGSGPT